MQFVLLIHSLVFWERLSWEGVSGEGMFSETRWKLHCLFEPQKHTGIFPPHFIGYQWVTQANQIKGERKLDPPPFWLGRGKVTLQKSKLHGRCVLWLSLEKYTSPPTLFGCFEKVWYDCIFIMFVWEVYQVLHHANIRWIILKCSVSEMLPFFIFLGML